MVFATPEARTPAWFERPGDQDITAHVDFTSVRAAAEAEGLTTLGFLDQTYFLMGLVSGWNTAAAEASGRPAASSHSHRVSRW